MSIDVNVQNDLVIVTETTEDIVVNVSNAAGPQGPAGAAGVGVPVGGSTGQVLKKFTNTNYDTYWAADASGLTSVGLSVPTGLTVTNSPLTTNGTIAVGLASGYSIPTTASQATWNTAYNDSIVSAAVTGTTTKTLTLNQQDGGSVTASWSDLNTDAVTSVFGRTGAVVATEGDYTLTQLGDVTLTSPTNGQVLKYNGTTWVNNTDTDTGLTSVGLSMPSAFAVSNSPLTSNGTLAVTGAGLATQYIRGDGQLATFPSTASGGSSVNYYLNGSINASVAGYKQLDNNAIIGSGTNFSLVGNGLIAQFLTDAGNPNRVQIPGGAWNFEMYFQVSSAGGNQKFYIELHKYDGSTFTLIASSSAAPEEITGGTAIDLYLTSLAVPTTALLITDRLAIRVYIVDNSGGRTITLHTENNTLCEIITTFAGGISSLNGLTANTQYLSTGTSGMDFNINSVSDTHTFNLPIASGTNTGKLSNTDWTTFNSKQNAITLTTTGSSGASTFISNTLNVPTYTLSGLGGVPTSRTLTINGTAFDLSADRTFSVGTVTSVAALTLGTTGTDLSSTVANGTTTPVITLNVPTASATNRGALSSADWTTFNNKQSTITNPVTGTGTTNYLPKWTSGSAIGNSLVYDNGTNVLINSVIDSGQKLQVNGTIKADGRIFINAGNGNQLYLNNAGERYTQITFDNNSTSISQAYLAWDSVANFFEMYAKIGGGLKFYANQSEAMCITTSSFVGIGTSTPSYKLDVNRSSLGAIAQFITLDGTYNPRLLINGTSEGIQLFATYSSGGAEALMFGTANTERMRLTSNLIIGSTVDSGERLQVSGSVKATSFIKSGGTSSQYLMADGSVTTGGGLISTNRQTASYTLALTDADKLVEMNVATANNLTVPLNSSVAFAIGTKIDLAQYGAGQTTVVATSGVTVRSAGGALKLAVQYSGGSLVKIGTDEWYLFGDITV